MGGEVSASVPPLPYAPVPAVPGLITVIGTVMGVAISEPEMVAVSWFALTCMVVWAAPFQFMVAAVEKLLPLTVMTKAGPPELTSAGTSSAIVGIDPAWSGVVAFEL